MVTNRRRRSRNPFAMTGIFVSSEIRLMRSLVASISCLLLNHGPSQQSCKENTSHRNEALLQDSTHLIQRPFYQRGSPCQDPAGNRTTRRPSDYRKETQTAVVWSCFPFIRSGQNILQGTVKGGKRQGRQRKRWVDNIRE